MKRPRPPYETRLELNHHDEPNQTCCSRRAATNQPRPQTDELDSGVQLKCTSFRKQENRFLDLPPEIILLILITLPVKSLSILKCVNRYFSRFISRPDFIKNHLKFSCEDASMSGYRVIINTYTAILITELKKISIPPIMWRESSVPSINPEDLKRESVKYVEQLGSCNGLLFISINANDLFIWNPTIRQHKNIPNIIKLESLKIYFSYFSFGFGFDVSGDDYKVVLLAGQNKHVDSGSEKKYVVFVYSLKRASWKRIPDFTGGTSIGCYGMCASGLLHYSTHRLDIVSFDLEREVFGTLEQPNYAEGCRDLALGVLGGSISVSYVYNNFVDVWVMKEYGKKESWNKIITLPDLITRSYPYSFLPNGEVLLKDNYFQIYNPVHKLSRVSKIPHYFDSLTYVESLVPPCFNCREAQSQREGRQKAAQ